MLHRKIWEATMLLTSDSKFSALCCSEASMWHPNFNTQCPLPVFSRIRSKSLYYDYPLRFSDLPPGLRCDTVLVMVTQLFSLYIYWVQLRKHDEIQKTNDFFNSVQNEVKFSDLRGHSLIVRATSCSMTSLLTHTVAHSTRSSFRPKTNNQPLKKFLSLVVSWVKVVKNGKILTFNISFLRQKSSESF